MDGADIEGRSEHTRVPTGTHLDEPDPSDEQLLRESGLFDESWYLARHPGVAAGPSTAVRHYLTEGAALGFDPGPGFRTTRYLTMHLDVFDAGSNPLVHYLVFGRAEGRRSVAATATPVIRHRRDEGRPSVLVVGAPEGWQGQGTAQSIIDELEALRQNGIDAVTVVPAGTDQQLLDELERCSLFVHALPEPSGWPRLAAQRESIEALVGLIRHHRVEAVHVHSVVPRDAMITARHLGLPLLVHVQEDLLADSDLSEWLGVADGQELVAWVAQHAQHVVVPSLAMHATFATAVATTVATGIARPFAGREPMGDPAALGAERAAASADPVRLAIAATRSDRDRLRTLLEARLPGRLVVVDAPTTPADTRPEIVVGLGEGVGLRGVLAGMASGLPVVAFAGGGAAERIADGETGFLVAHGAWEELVDRVAALVDDPALRQRMGAAGRHLVAEAPGRRTLASELGRAYSSLLPHLPATDELSLVALERVVEQSPLLDAAWYQEAHPDVAASGLSPARHYLLHGARRGYDPGPQFESSRYLRVYDDVAVTGINPLIHFELYGAAENRTPRARPWRVPRPTGRARPNGHRPRVLVVGHMANAQLFGAERSLLDLLDGFAAIGFDTIVTLPVTHNATYLHEVESRCHAMHTISMPAGWPDRSTFEETAERYAGLIREHGIDAVHINTIVPRDALIAARRCGVPGVAHAREIPFDDLELCLSLGCDGPEALIRDVLSVADHIVATSQATATAYQLAGATSVVPNVVDAAKFAAIERDPDRRVRIALIGSTSERKGLPEFVEVARMLDGTVDATFVVVGPQSPLVTQLQGAADLPGNLEFAGYANDPVSAMAEADIVVNLSRARESFGRTLLEAMASGLPVVAFARGGIPEVVRHDECGFLVRSGDLAAVAEHLRQLVRDPELRLRMGERGREIAAESFGPDALADALDHSYRAILPTAEACRQSAGDIVVRLPDTNVSSWPDPYFVGNIARFASCSSVRFLDAERLVVCSLVGREMHLVELDEEHGTGAIVSTTPTTDGVRGVSVDLLDIDGEGRIVAANCDASSVSWYRVEEGAIVFEGALPVDAQAEPYCHGVARVAGRPGQVAVALTTLQPQVRFLIVPGADDRQDSVRPIPPFVHEGWIPKSMTFVDSSRMIVPMRRQNVGLDPRLVHHSQLVLVLVDETAGDHRILDTLDLPNSAVDGCDSRLGRVYVADQANSVIVVVEVVGDRLRRLPDLEGFFLPHDVCISPDGRLVGVANYGTNDLHIRRLPAGGG